MDVFKEKIRGKEQMLTGAVGPKNGAIVADSEYQV
jgi:hypothetical protein